MRNDAARSRKRVALLLLTFASLFVVATTLFVVQSSHPRKAFAADLTGNYAWKQLKIGGGGFVTGIALHPTVPGLVYVRTDTAGAYKLGPNDTWQQLITTTSVPNPASGDYNVESIAVSKTNPQRLYLAVGNSDTDPTGRILVSTNQGQSFSDNGQRWRISGNGEYRTASERLVVDPNNDNIAYFGSRKDGLWVTNNGGQSWTQVSTSSVPVGTNTGTPAGDEFVLFDSSSGTTNGKTNRIYVGVSGSGVYMSNDAGTTWTNVLSSTLIPYSASIASDGTLYIGFTATSGNGSVYRYSPSSNSSTNISPASNNYYEVTVDPQNPQRVIVGSGGVSNGNIWRTTNGGTTWDTLNISLSSPTTPWVAKTDEGGYMTSAHLTFDPLVPDKLWFPQGIGVWYSSNNTGSTINWQFYSQGIEQTVTSDLIAPPGGSPVSTIYDRQGFYHANLDSDPDHTLVDSVFWGGTGVDYSGGTPSTVVTVQAKNNYYPYLSGRGAISTDKGQTFHLFASLPPNNIGGNIAISATDTNNLVWLPSSGTIGQGFLPYYSTDGGQSWNQSSGISNTNTHWLFWWGVKRALASDKVNNAFYALTFSTTTSPTGSFYVSSDGGKTFAQAPYSPACSTNGDCHVFGQIRATPGFAGHVWSSAGKDGLWYTSDAGQRPWLKVSAVQEARGFGFGQALPGYGYPAIYLYGRANGDTTFGVYRSADQGATWSLLSRAPLGIYDGINVVNGDMNIPGRVYVGFSGNGFAYGDDQNVNIDPTPTPTPLSNGPLPLPWQHQDVGSVGLSGSAGYYNGTYTINGSGNDIWSNYDGFHYVYQSLSGDGSIIARVTSQQDTDPWAKAGVMIRNTLDQNSVFADMMLTPGMGTAFQRRTTLNTTDDGHTPGPNLTTPVWVKLTRSGDTFTGYVSSDGSSWTQVGSDTVVMANTVYIGLAVTAHNNTALNTSTFDNVSVSITGAAITHATTPPTIDGNNSDDVWSSATSYSITQVQGSPSGFSGTFKAAWDSNNLYFLVSIQDASASSHADMTEIYLDPNHDRGSHYDSIDMQYMFPSDSTTVKQFNNGQPGTNTTGIVFAYQTVSNGYQVEIAIPWSTLGVTPSSGSQLGIDLDIWQNYTSNVKNKLYWNDASDNDWTNPNLFGLATLQP